LVGRIHNCTPLLMAAVNNQPPVVSAVNIAETEPVRVVNKRGAYPGTEERRKYMREYMRKTRAK
jgi:hypothetical protein